jgi:hypothetical protein
MSIGVVCKLYIPGNSLVKFTEIAIINKKMYVNKLEFRQLRRGGN